jgi:hypothetical protein
MEAQLQADSRGSNSSKDQTTPPHIQGWMDAILPPAECKRERVSGIGGDELSFSIKSCILRASIHYIVHVSDDIQAYKVKNRECEQSFSAKDLAFPAM